MNLFESLVQKALENKPEYQSLQIVVEKEILHHDILAILSEKGYLSALTFIGGTCLRDCYGSPRLSEDLDFTGGTTFSASDLRGLGDDLVQVLKMKYGCSVTVTEPKREEGNVDTWKIKVITRPDSPHVPQQRINIDICSVPSHDVQVRTVLDHYGVAVSSHGLYIRAQSQEEILADKVLALAMRPNRFKARDVWDLQWLNTRGVKFQRGMLEQKLLDRSIAPKQFLELYSNRINHELNTSVAQEVYYKEMERFLPSPSDVQNDVQRESNWLGILNVIKELV